MSTSATLIDALLQSKSIIIDPANPFQWSSGWNSPIYCDNRRTLSYPDIRNLIRDAFVDLIGTHFSPPDLIAGVATGAIAHAALVADKTGLPLVYIRPAAKSHGTRNVIEGDISMGRSVVIVEDLISTGTSSLHAVHTLKEAGCQVLGMVAIFTYGFRIAEENFLDAGIKLFTLTNYDELIEQAVRINYISQSDIQILNEWRKSPHTWNK
jgi:orotate phosphoribosyltransferase